MRSEQESPVNHILRASASLLVAVLAPAAFAAPVTVYNFNGNANDSVGGRNLTLTATSFSNDTPSGTGQSLAFDGVNSRATYDVVGADALSGSYTVAAYVKYTGVSVSAGGTVRTYFGTRGPGEMSFDAKLIDANKVHGDLGTGGAWVTTAADANFNYNLNQWYHVAYAVNSPGQYFIYVDGNLVGGASLPGNVTPLLLFDANHDIAVGSAAASGGNAGELFQGLIDNVGIYNTALSQAEVRALLVPEPATIGLTAVATLGLLAGRRRRY
jgi:hypothetical protein